MLRLSKEPGREDDVHIAFEGVESVNTIVAISPHECTISVIRERRLRYDMTGAWGVEWWSSCTKGLESILELMDMDCCLYFVQLQLPKYFLVYLGVDLYIRIYPLSSSPTSFI